MKIQVIAAILFVLLAPALVWSQGPNVGTSVRDQEQSSTRRGIERNKELETRRGRSNSERQGEEARKTTEKSKATSTSQESRESVDQNRTNEINIDLSALGVRLLARAERDPTFLGPIALVLQRNQVFSRPRMPILEPYMTHNPGGNMGKHHNYYPNWPRQKPDLPVQSGYYNLAGYGLAWRHQPVGLKLDGSPPFIRYPTYGPNYQELFNFSGSYILSALLLRDALNSLCQTPGVIDLPPEMGPEEAIYDAMRHAAASIELLEEAKEMTANALFPDGCDVPTTTGFAGNVDALRCAGLIIRPREHQVNLAGLPLLGQQVFGRNYSARFAKSKSTAKSASESTTTDRRSSSSRARFSANEQTRETSFSSSRRRSSSIGSSTDNSSSSDSQSSISVSPK